MNFRSKTRNANRQLYIICFAITGFTAVLLTGGFLIRGADAQQYPPTGIVYTESNIPTENGNSILGFRRDASGTLIPLPTPSFPTGGTGIPNAKILDIFGITVTTTLDSDQQVIVNPEHTRLFAVNTGSNTIAVFDIRKDGSLSPVKGSPFPSDGVGPISLGLAGDFLYVLNWNIDPQNPSQEISGFLPNYTAFRVTPKGRLIPVKNSTVSIPNGSRPFQVLISPDKHLLFSSEAGSSLLRSFKILSNGQLRQSANSPKALPESPLGSPPNIPLGIQVHPQQPILYVTFSNLNQLGVYFYDRITGDLTFLKAVPNSGIAPCWIVINRAASRLYTTNPDDNSISVYDIQKDPTTPVEIQKVTLKGSAGGAQLTLDSTESFLQVVSQPITVDATKDNALSVLKVNPDDGTLSEVLSSPLLLPSIENSFPQGIFAN